MQVQILNINHGRNAELLQVCHSLSEYSWLVERIREYRTEINDGLESAVDRAIGDMPNSFEIRPFLEAHRAEVKGMLLEEYNEDEIRNLFKEEGRVEGRAEGRAEGINESIRAMYEDGLEPDRIARILKMDLTEVEIILGLRKMA